MPLHNFLMAAPVSHGVAVKAPGEPSWWSRLFTPKPTINPAIVAAPLVDRAYLEVDANWVEEHRSVLALTGRTSLAFTFFDVESGFQESGDVQYEDVDCIGRPESFKTYAGNSNREVGINFQFQVQGEINGWGILTDYLEEEVIAPARWLDSLRYPLISSSTGLSYAPPPLMLHLGNLLVARVLLTDCQITWNAPFEPSSMLPYGAEVSTTFTIVRHQITNYPGGVWV